MSSLTTFVDCPNLQDRLTDVFCQPGGSEPLPLIGFLFSPENNGGALEQRAISGTNIRTVELVYTRRVLESEVDNFINVNTCTASDKRGETSEIYTFDETKGLEIAKKFSFSDLWRRCESDEMYFARLVSELIDGAERKMETQAATYLAANIGAFASIDTDGVVGTLKTVATKLSDGTTDYDAYEQIMASARFAQFCSAPIIAGDFDIAYYFDRIDVGCCATTGLDFSRVAAGLPTLLKSYRIGTALGSNTEFLVMSAGSALPIWHNRYVGGLAAAMSSETQQYTTVVSRRGIPFDLSVIRDCDDVSVKISLAWDLFFAPDTMYENSDILDGVNGILNFKVTNPS